MCLYTTEKRAAKAKKSIICYKVVRRFNSIYAVVYSTPVFTSLYHDFEYRPGKLRREKKFKCMPRESGAVYFGFHSYATLHAAHIWAGPDDVILKCEIPDSSRYYTSITGEEYCSNRIKVIAWRKATERKWHS